MQASATGIIGGTFAIVKERFGPMLGMLVIYFVIQIVLSIVLSASIGASFAMTLAAGRNGGLGGLGAGGFLMVGVFYLAIFALYAAQTASLTALASPLQRLSFGDALNIGFRCVPTMLGVLVILGVAYFALALVAGMLLGVLAFVSSWLAILGGLVLIPGVIYLASRLSVINAVVAVDREMNPIAAISRSWNLTRGNVMAIFLALVLFVVLAAIGIAIVITPSFSTIMAASNGGNAVPSFAGMGVTFLLGIVFGLVFALAASALVSVIHAELAGTLQQDSEVFA